MTLQAEGAGASAATAAVEPFWLKSYPPGIQTSIDPDTYPSLAALLIDACAHHAARPAFECLGVVMTYSEWDRVSRAFAAFLVEQTQCKPGERVAIMLPNLLAYPVAFLGALRAGLIVVNVNPLYTPRELQAQLADPSLYAKDRQAFDQASTALVTAQGELAQAEHRWLELEILREEIVTERET